MSDHEQAKEKGQAQPSSTAIWDARFCGKDYCVYMMTIIPQDAIGADMTKHADHNSCSPKAWRQNERFQPGLWPHGGVDR